VLEQIKRGDHVVALMRQGVRLDIRLADALAESRDQSLHGVMRNLDPFHLKMLPGQAQETRLAAANLQQAAGLFIGQNPGGGDPNWALRFWAS
jgi:hypothetical protein